MNILKEHKEIALIVVILLAFIGLMGSAFTYVDNKSFEKDIGSALSKDIESRGIYSTDCYRGFVFVKYMPNWGEYSDLRITQLIGANGKPVTCVEKEGTK